MIVVIQCAASKKPNAGYLRSEDGRPVLFIAQPSIAPLTKRIIYARPDDVADTGRTWREELLSVNRAPRNNASGLLPAVELYENAIYGELAQKVGPERLFILSAGWGLIPATFLIPVYDITFSAAAHDYKRRRPKDRYDDFRLLPPDAEGPILFVGGRDYVPHFASLTSNSRAERIVFYSAAEPPRAPRCRLVRYPTATRTNWHYECARDFVQDRLPLV